MEKLNHSNIAIYLQAVLENITEAVWLIGTDYRLLWYNKRFEDVMLASFTKMIQKGENVLEVDVPEATIDFWKRRYDSCLVGRTIHEIDTYLPSRVILKVRMSPIYEGDKVTGVLSFVADIQENKEQEQELWHIRQNIEEQRHRQAQFLHKISHELKTPLNGILGLTNLLLHENPTPEQREHLEKVNVTTKHMARITENALDILDFSRKETDFLPKKLNLDLFLAQIESNYRVLCEQQKLTFALYKENIAPSQAFLTDEQALGTLLEELLQNAIQNTPSGNIELHIKTQPHEVQNYTILQCKVHDTGNGIAPNVLTKLFEILFGQVPAHQKNLKGLPLVRHLSDKLGSFLEIKSYLGEGTTFTIELPMKIAETVVEATETHTILDSLAGLRVLFVEDNILNQKWTGRFLQNWQVDVDYAYNGKQAIEKVLQCPAEQFYHAILMDLQMPEVDGYEATKAIRAYSQVPIIALSATPIAEFKGKAKDLAIQDFISKPFEPEILHQKLKECTAYNWFVRSEKGTEKVLADFKAVEEFAEGDTEYSKEMFGLYKKFFEEFLARFKEAVENQDLKMLKALTHKAKPSVKLMNLTTIEDELNRVAQLLEEHTTINTQEQISTTGIERYCQLCLAHLHIYSPDLHES